MSVLMTDNLGAPLPVFHDRDCDLSIIGSRLFATTLLLTAFTAGAATAQTSREVGARVERYRACPVADVSVQLFTSPPVAWTTGESDVTLRMEEFWPGDPGWIQPKPVPDEVLFASSSWIAPRGMIDRHEAVRLRNSWPLPQGSPRILLFEHANHWSAYESSIVAVRGTDGVWRVDQVWETNAGTEFVKPAETSKALSHEGGVRLDGLLADQCLGAEPLSTDWAPLTSSTYKRWVVEIEDETSARRFAGAHVGFGRVGAIRHLLSQGMGGIL